MRESIRSLMNSLSGRNRAFGEKFTRPMVAVEWRADQPSPVRLFAGFLPVHNEILWQCWHQQDRGAGATNTPSGVIAFGEA